MQTMQAQANDGEGAIRTIVLTRVLSDGELFPSAPQCFGNQPVMQR